MSLDGIDTPAVLVDLDKAEANIRAFQAYADRHGLKVRPHIKTHKLPRLAAYQVAQGAVGITCQKVSEAEAMVVGGEVDDVLITYNILGEKKLRRLRALSERIRLSVVADNLVVAEGLSATFRGAEGPLDVLVECNTGADRCGVESPEAAAELAKAIEAMPGLRFAGLMTYPPIGKPGAVADWLGRAKALIEAEGIGVPTISSGGSPDIWKAHEMPLATEYRVGTYVYNDGFLVGQGTCAWEDCALTVLATVVSVPAENRAVIDAGSKVLTSDLLGLEGHGRILGRPDLAIDQLSEEHGRIVSEGPVGLAVGQRLRIVPNHACVVSNMLDQVELVRGETYLGSTPVAARGKVW
ncbi:D-TA family PLP-dependent enzyme [Aliiruegeria lutimaris]|uniref:D-serine deaminase, pyridoxal phosphate-dependent n=1 Tax=Aliiruegeria lutimaris TaxID=571298 RepID=A0A1G9D7V8_9RHOB|nr:D-TA family PLP-dependent enzyme [Aliiruegeria lutimaris]SDK59982.1 D-serine deaminase, pyridoxal phosphate-dependent [Aliiruegeria lutimaris]